MAKVLGRPKTKSTTVGLRAFFKIARDWELSSEQQIKLLGLPDTTFYNLKKKLAGGNGPTISKDTLERISYVLGIYKNLQLLLADQESANTWVRRPNNAPLFGGKPAIDRMTIGNVADLYVVRQYLDSQVRGW